MATTFFFDADRLGDIARERADGYQNAPPFPHIVLDDFLPEEVLDVVLSEFPAPGDVPWWRFASEKERKLASTDDSIMGPATRHLLAQFNSSAFLSFLEALTGIKGLIPDVHYYGGGLHQIERGGFLSIHADFDRHPTLNLERRLNLLLYLNRGWEESFGGHLELWNQDMTACDVRVLPIFNRVVVFNTTGQSFHGHPEPLRCPADVTRKSLALYYYTADSGNRPIMQHNTRWQARPADQGSESPEPGLRSIVRRTLPPWALDRVRRIRNRVSPSRVAIQQPSSSAPPDSTEVNSMFRWAQSKGLSRPEYLWPVLQAARSAANLDIKRISVVEFGVAGGNGLLALEQAASAAESLLPVGIDVFGFDTGTGMPEPLDHRDVPWTIEAGYFAMDETALRARLHQATLVLGNVAETVDAWIEAAHPPVGFISFDLDYYSSTVDAFALLRGPADRLLPRIVCYFDDILGFGWSDFNGERAAIAEFNEQHELRKIGLVHGLRYLLPPSELHVAWPEKIFVAHLFDHPRYNASEGRPASYWFESLRLAPEEHGA